RKYLTFGDGTRSYFPTRRPRTVKFAINDADPNDPYARLTSKPVVRAVDKLNLPRYGLGNYVAASPEEQPTPEEKRQLEGLSRAGKRLMGFSRTNLFKRLESGGTAFLLSVERHVLRNFIFLHAIENDLPLPIGSQAAEYLDSRTNDEDAEEIMNEELRFMNEDEAEIQQPESASFLNLNSSLINYRERAAEVYGDYRTK